MANNNKVGAFEFYVKLFYHLITRGNAPDERPNPSNPLPEGYFFYSTNRIYTPKKIKKVFFVADFPRYLNANFFAAIKTKLRGIGRLSIQFHSEPYTLDLTSRRSQAQVQMWENRFNEMTRKKQEQSTSQKILESDYAKQEAELTDRMIESYLYVTDAKDRNVSFCRTNVIFELVADTEIDFLRAEKILKESLFLAKVDYNETFLLTNEYYSAFSPVGNQQKSLLADKNPPYVITDEVLASFSYPTQGIFGDDHGYYVGSDRFTSLPATISFTKTEDAANILLAAETGEGKSTYMRGLINSAFSEGHYIVMSDYEGDEYTAVGKLYGALRIDLSGRTKQSMYFDTTQIADRTGDPEIDASLKISAFQSTLRVFDMIIDENNGMDFREKAIISDALNNAYRRVGVTEDWNTWPLSKSLRYQNIYWEVLELGRNQQYKTVYGQALVDLIDKLRVWFEVDGPYYHVFSNPISINDLLGRRFVLFSFGERGASQIATDKKVMAMKQLMFSDISNRIANHNRFILNAFTVVAFEEFQRALLHKYTGNIAVDHITGGRKRNEIVVLITNSPSQLIDLMKMASGHSEPASFARAILDNIQVRVIGRIKRDAVESLCDVFSMDDCKPMLHHMDENEDKFKHCFLINYKRESAVVKMQIPATLVPYYRTRNTDSDPGKAG